MLSEYLDVALGKAIFIAIYEALNIEIIPSLSECSALLQAIFFLKMNKQVYSGSET